MRFDLNRLKLLIMIYMKEDKIYTKRKMTSLLQVQKLIKLILNYLKQKERLKN